jgi:hypothetical protein
MAPTIITRCETKGCGHHVVVATESAEGPVTGECTGCGASWELADGRLRRLAVRAPRHNLR